MEIYIIDVDEKENCPPQLAANQNVHVHAELAASTCTYDIINPQCMCSDRMWRMHMCSEGCSSCPVCVRRLDSSTGRNKTTCERFHLALIRHD